MKALFGKPLLESQLGRGAFSWQSLQRFLTAPLIAGMTVVICALAAVYAGIAAHSASYIAGFFSLVALGSAFAAALTGAGPRLLSAALIALGACASTGALLWRISDITQAVGNVEAALTLRAWTPWLIVPLFAACALATLPAIALRTWLRGRSGRAL